MSSTIINSLEIGITSKRLKVLISAYACEPNRGSEPGVGWNIACGLASQHDVWVLTRANNRRVIETELAKHPVQGLHFIYHDLSSWVRFWKRGRRGLHLYYYLWQITARKPILAMHKLERFDIAHHITFASYWLPTCLVFLPIPFIWGPLGGGEDAPLPFWPGMGLFGILYETIRILRRSIAEFDPLIRNAAKRSAHVFATAPRTGLRVEQLGHRQVELMSEVAFVEDAQDLAYLLSVPAPPDNCYRFISVGNLNHVKALHLGLQAFARAAINGSEYWIIGDGRDRQKLERLAHRLGIDERVRFFGAQPRNEVLRLLSECHALLHPSLHDSGGWACLEAMAAARPVLCLNLGGPATQVTSETGFRCSASYPTVAVQELSEAMKRIAGNPILHHAMGQAGRKRVCDHYLIKGRIQYFSECYRRAIQKDKQKTDTCADFNKLGAIP
jgi:glycosyltransferase involved in cell wall biosynthesis